MSFRSRCSARDLRLPQGIRAYALAAFVSIFVIGLAGFSLWPAWYLAAYGLAALCIVTVACLGS